VLFELFFALPIANARTDQHCGWHDAERPRARSRRAAHKPT